jgi:hypothetical protein
MVWWLGTGVHAVQFAPTQRACRWRAKQSQRSLSDAVLRLAVVVITPDCDEGNCVVTARRYAAAEHFLGRSFASASSGGVHRDVDILRRRRHDHRDQPTHVGTSVESAPSGPRRGARITPLSKTPVCITAMAVRMMVHGWCA